jgi:hypothetical protein
MQVTAASARLGTIANSVTSAVGESNVQAAAATVSSLGAKTREAVSSTVSFLEEKGIVSGAQGLVSSAGATAKSVFSFAQSGVSRNANHFMLSQIFIRNDMCQWQGFWAGGANQSQIQDISNSKIADAGRVEVICRMDTSLPCLNLRYRFYLLLDRGLQTSKSLRVIPSTLQQVSSIRSSAGGSVKPPEL